MATNQEKDFIKDVWKYYSTLKLPLESIEVFDCDAKKYERMDDYQIAYSLLPKSTLQLFFHYGVADYHIDMDYNQFIRYFISRDSLRHYRFGFSFYYREESTKYQKRDHHNKKFIDENRINKMNWHTEKKLKRDQSKSGWSWRGYNCRWSRRKKLSLNNQINKEMKEEVDLFLYG